MLGYVVPLVIILVFLYITWRVVNDDDERIW